MALCSERRQYLPVRLFGRREQLVELHDSASIPLLFVPTVGALIAGRLLPPSPASHRHWGMDMMTRYLLALAAILVAGCSTAPDDNAAESNSATQGTPPPTQSGIEYRNIDEDWTVFTDEATQSICDVVNLFSSQAIVLFDSGEVVVLPNLVLHHTVVDLTDPDLPVSYLGAKVGRLAWRTDGDGLPTLFCLDPADRLLGFDLTTAALAPTSRTPQQQRDTSCDACEILVNNHLCEDFVSQPQPEPQEPDSCPDDPMKSAPGLCGCGVPDTDSDDDGFPNCLDQCPDDPQKSGAGVCGCGISDVDNDLDAVPDCVDVCPEDPFKSMPGQCGCGELDLDLDADGYADLCGDNCPFVSNPDQRDADMNGIGDACEIAPLPDTLTIVGIYASEVIVLSDNSTWETYLFIPYSWRIGDPVSVSASRISNLRLGDDLLADELGTAIGTMTIASVVESGTFVQMLDGSIWQIGVLDRIRTTLWLPFARVILVEPFFSFGTYVLIHESNGDIVDATLISQ